MLTQNENLVQKQDEAVAQIKLYVEKISKLSEENFMLTNSLQSAGQAEVMNKNLLETIKNLQDQIEKVQNECYLLKNLQSVQDNNTNGLKDAYFELQNCVNDYSQKLEDKDRTLSAKDYELLRKNQDIEELNKQLDNFKKGLVKFYF